MNSRELILRALRGEETPRPAAGPLAVHFCARLAGVSVTEYTLDPAVLSESVLRYFQRFKPDAVWISADTWVSAEAMGAQVVFPGRNQPLSGTSTPLIQSWEDLERIAPPDPKKQGRWPRMIEAVRRVKQAIGQEAFIVGCFDQFPFSLACAVMGLEKVMLKSVDEPELVEALMERCQEYTFAYALALAEAGADMLSGGDSPAGLLGPKLYRRLALPFERQVIAHLRERTKVPISLHICGDTRPLLSEMRQAASDVLEIDHQVDVAEASRIVGPDIALWGNLDTVSLLSRSSPEAVAAATKELIQKFQNCGHARYVVSSGCALAMETPVENLSALFETVRNFEQ